MGLATAKKFVEEGVDHVFVTGRRKKVLDSAVVEIGSNASAVQGDVANLADLDHLFEVVRSSGRELDVVFANAGVAQIAPLGSVDEAFFDLHFNANVKGLFFICQQSIDRLRDFGRVVNIAWAPGLAFSMAICANPA